MTAAQPPVVIKSYKLTYDRGGAIPFFVNLCPGHVATRVSKGATVKERRTPVTKTACADCDPKAALR